jgi:hypothetical protein
MYTRPLTAKCRQWSRAWLARASGPGLAQSPAAGPGSLVTRACLASQTGQPAARPEGRRRREEFGLESR